MYWRPDHEEWRRISEPLWSYHFLEDRERAYGSATWGDVALFVKEGILELVLVLVLVLILVLELVLALNLEPEQEQEQEQDFLSYAAALFQNPCG